MLTILCGDVIEQLRTLPDESVHCCVTSPPYWGLRDYGTAEWEGGEVGCDHSPDVDWLKRNFTSSGSLGTPKPGNDAQFKAAAGRWYNSDGSCKCGAKRIDSQLGLEKTPEEYVAKMVEVFREVRRVLRKDGTLWLNLGDSYATQGGKQPDDAEWKASQVRATNRGYDVGGWGACRNKTQGAAGRAANTAVSGLKPKDLCGIPWRLAFALQADGWWLRSDIIWAKPNPMPESVTDRPTKAHEYIFLMTKSANYFYDAEAIREPHSESTFRMNPRYGTEGNTAATKENPDSGFNIKTSEMVKTFPVTYLNPAGRNKRTVWTVATAPYPEAHFATYPPDLIKPCILAGTSAKGCCAKCGSPWERIVDRGELVGYDRGGNYSGRRIDAMVNKNHGTPGLAYENKTIGWQPTCKCRTYQSVEYKSHPCTVVDPFAGSGTTGVVALELGRKAILIELNPKYVELIKTRCNVTPGLQLA